MAARIGYRGRWPYQFVWDAELVWAHRPGWAGWIRGGAWAELNGLGLREREPLTEAKARPRVLVLGDSIAFGYALAQEETIAARLEAAWNGAHPEAALDVINGGVSGYATEQETLLLERIGPRIRPDLVVLLLCLANDVSVESVASYHAREGVFNPGRKGMAVRSPALAALFDHSAFAYWIGRKVNRWRIRRLRAQTAEQHAHTGLRFSNLADFQRLPGEVRAAELELLRGRLAGFRGAAERLGVPVCVVVCPDQALLDQGAAEGGPPAVLGEVVAAVSASGLSTHSLWELYRREGPALLRPKDGIHPSAAGAARIAEHLLGELVRRGLWPTK